MIVRVENIPLTSVPRVVRPDQFIDGIPSLFVIWGRGGLERRLRHHLPPEKAFKVFCVRARNHAVGDVEIRVAIVIKIPGIAGPGPAAYLRACSPAGILEVLVPFIAEKRISPGMFAIRGADPLGRVLHESFLHREAIAGSGPHIGDVEILFSVIIVVEPADTHSSADIFHFCVRRNVAEGSVTIVSVKIVASKVIGDVKIGPTIVVVIAPATGKTVAVIVLMEVCLGGNIAERSVAVIAKEKIGWTILGIEIRYGKSVLVLTLVINVGTKIDVQPPISVKVGKGHCSEVPLRRLSKTEAAGV